MKSKFLYKAILIFCFFSTFSYAENKSLFEDFIKINNAFISKTQYATQELIIYENNKIIKTTDSYSVFSKNSQVTQFENTFVLNTPQGYWILNNKMKSPLKISGNYKVEQVEIQDVLRIDFETDYKIIEKIDDNINDKTDNIANVFFLERTNKKMIYPFIKIECKSNSNYNVCFMDINKKEIRKIIYNAQIINGVFCFADIEVHDKVFENNKYFKYVTLSLKEVDVPYSLFSSSQFINLVQYIKKFQDQY